MKVFADFTCNVKQYISMGKRARAGHLFASSCFLSYFIVAIAVVAVEFASNQTLPIPLNAETAKLFDALAAALPKPLSRLK